MRRCFLMALLMLCGVAAAQPLRVMEWNVENMFHPSGDGDFTPGGAYRWTHGRFMRKANLIAQALAAEGRPDILGLCEIEDDSTLTGLTRMSVMNSKHYEWVRTHGCDRRGINVALVYDQFRFRPVAVREVRVPSEEHGHRPTRNLLYVAGEVLRDLQRDTLHVIVCHLPSQSGGTRQADRHRRLAADVLMGVVDSVLAVSPQAAIVVMGDFNGDAGRLLRLRDKGRAPGGLRALPFDFAGTYRYQGDWSHLDHLLCSARVQADSIHVVRVPFLLEENKTHGGVQPKRTFRGPSYHGGVSDHLPIAVVLGF